ncbi:MAG: hypothetical protein N3A72_03055 [bacterium]|nr:hypothetical protein [bacterium]
MKTHFLNWLIYLIIFVLLLPAIYYSLKTPFGLIDDYIDWQVVKLAENASEFAAWVNNTFINLGSGRYRPFLYIYNFFVWFLFGPNPVLHHAFRWVVKLISFYFWIKCLSLFIQTNHEQQSLHQGKDNVNRCFIRLIKSFNIPVLTFSFIFFFFPNNPEARLAPVELHTGLFLAIINYAIAILIVQSNGEFSSTSRLNLFLIYISYFGLSIVKEINIILLFIFLLIFIILESNHSSKKYLFRLLPLILVLLYTFFRVKLAFQGGGYGVPTITLKLLVSNGWWLVRSILLLDTQIILSIAFLLLGLVRLGYLRKGIYIWGRIYGKTQTIAKSNTFFLILIIEFIGLYCILCTSWEQALRYWYPVVPLLAIILAFSTIPIWAHAKNNRRFGMVIVGGVVLFLFFFLVVNYHNFLYQFLVQYNARTIEKRLLTELDQKLSTGAVVVVKQVEEYEQKIMLYFNEFLPYYYKRNNPVLIDWPSNYIGVKKIYYVSREPNLFGLTLETTFTRIEEYPCLTWSGKLAALLQGKKTPYQSIDAGAQPIDGYSWYLYSISKNEVDKTQQRILASNNPFEIYEFRSLYQSNQRAFPELFQEIDKKYRAIISEYTKHQGFAVNSAVSFLGYYYKKIDPKQYKLYLLFKTEELMDTDWAIYVHGKVAEEDVSRLPEKVQSWKGQNWDFWPDPPTSTWRKNESIIVSRVISAEPIPYNIVIGFYKGGKTFGKPIPLGWIDFATDNLDGLLYKRWKQLSISKNIFEIGEFLQTYAFYENIIPELYREIASSFETLCIKHQSGKEKVIHPAITFIDVYLKKLEPKKYRLYFLFKVNQPLEKDWLVYIHGRVKEEDVGLLPESNRQMKGQNWDFYPYPVTTHWPVGKYVIIHNDIIAEPLSYKVIFGFYRDGEGTFGEAIDLGWIDFQ